MKLEVPHSRIMRGEASDLSPAAKGLLLSLIACQDQFTKTTSRSKANLADISGLDCRTVYYALKELTDKKWIIRNRQLIQLVTTTQTFSEPHITNHTFSEPQASETATDTGLDCSLPEPQASQTALADAYDQDQIDLKDHSDPDFLPKITVQIAEFYQMTPSNYRRLWTILQGKDINRIYSVFEVMQRQVIRDPISYLITSLGNGNGQQTFQSFISSLPDKF